MIKNNWISVKDRLPKQFESVLLWGNTFDEPEIGYLQSRGGYRNDYDRNVFTNCSITHWQPLPDPPEGT